MSIRFTEYIDGVVRHQNPPLLVAEAGLNHNGNLEIALEMVRVAARSGAGAFKIQAYSAEEFCGRDAMLVYQTHGVSASFAESPGAIKVPISVPGASFGDGHKTLGHIFVSERSTVQERQIDLFRRCQLSMDDISLIRAECLKHSMLFIATATDDHWIQTMLNMGVDALKVGSDDLVHTPLLQSMARSGVPVILSTGMCDAEEIRVAIQQCRPAVLLHCVSLYPTSVRDVNLSRITRLVERFPGRRIGFSDHTCDSDPAIPGLAAAMGAVLIEKHFTLDRKMRGPDHWFSATENELAMIARTLKVVQIARGSGDIPPSDAEMKMRTVARRSIVAAVDIPAGVIIELGMLTFRRPGIGLPPSKLDLVLGRRALKDIRAGDLVQQAHISSMTALEQTPLDKVDTLN